MTGAELQNVLATLRSGRPVATGIWWLTNFATVTVDGVPLLKDYPRSANNPTRANPRCSTAIPSTSSASASRAYSPAAGISSSGTAWAELRQPRVRVCLVPVPARVFERRHRHPLTVHSTTSMTAAQATPITLIAIANQYQNT